MVQVIASEIFRYFFIVLSLHLSWDILVVNLGHDHEEFCLDYEIRIELDRAIFPGQVLYASSILL